MLNFLRKITKSDQPGDERRRVMENPLATREELVAQRIWVDMNQKRIPFEGLSDQRLINIYIYLHHRAYKRALVAYFANMGPLCDNEYVYIDSNHTAYQAVRSLHSEPIICAVLDEMVARGTKVAAMDEAISTDEECDPDWREARPF